MKTTTEWKDRLIIGLFLMAGGVAALLFVSQGQAQALPPLAIGALLGVSMVARSFSDE
jgi:hypothetical protein